MKPSPDLKAKDELIQQLSAQVQTLTDATSSLQTQAKELQKLKQIESSSPCICYCPERFHEPPKRNTYDCPDYIAHHKINCNHCFACGEEGHCTVECLKRTRGYKQRTQTKEPNENDFNSVNGAACHSPDVIFALQTVAHFLGQKCHSKYNPNGYSMQ